LYVSHSSLAGILRSVKKYYIYSLDNLFLFPTVKEFSKLVNTDEVIENTFFKHSVHVQLAGKYSVYSIHKIKEWQMSTNNSACSPRLLVKECEE